MWTIPLPMQRWVRPAHLLQSNTTTTIMGKKRNFWISLSLINLCLVAFLGFCLRSKILFPIPFIDYRNFLSAHSHFAFAGWAGLALVTLLIYDLLPEHRSQKKFYEWVLAALEISSLGMAFTFPFFGYNALSIFFSTLYIVAVVAFAPVFIKDLLKGHQHTTVKLLAVSAVSALILSFAGTLGLVYILLSKSGNSILYRDSIYTFLHFQYNGFFTLSVFALAFNYVLKKGVRMGRKAGLFAFFLCCSIIPGLFLSLLWHNSVFVYTMAALGCIFIILSLVYFFGFVRSVRPEQLFPFGMARTFWLFCIFSFGLKMLLNAGTIIPQLGNAVYGNRPVIIGFLHLVFLGFLTFFLLAILIENGYFTKHNKIPAAPFFLFSLGIFANEILLMVQGLGVLFQTNSTVYTWLLWISSIILFVGATWIALARLSVVKTALPKKKKP